MLPASAPGCPLSMLKQVDLPAPFRADQGEDFAFSDLEGNAADGAHPAERLARASTLSRLIGLPRRHVHACLPSKGAAPSPRCRAGMPAR